MMTWCLEHESQLFVFFWTGGFTHRGWEPLDVAPSQTCLCAVGLLRRWVVLFLALSQAALQFSCQNFSPHLWVTHFEAACFRLMLSAEDCRRNDLNSAVKMAFFCFVSPPAHRCRLSKVCSRFGNASLYFLKDFFLKKGETFRFILKKRFIKGILTFCIQCWGRKSSLQHKTKQHKVAKLESKMKKTMSSISSMTELHT